MYAPLSALTPVWTSRPYSVSPVSTRSTPPPPVEEFHLTSQETKLLGLLAEGHGYQAAADRMIVSVNTVRNYVRSVYEKLHVHSSSEAVSKALRLGLIS